MADVDVAVDAEMLLLDKAIRDFMLFAGEASARLFFNANNRVLNAHLEHRPHMRAILERHSLPTARFCIELSEAETLNVSRSQQFFNGWEDRPLIALDDFGTGYSSFNYLRHFQVHKLKIDRSFVRDVMITQGDAAIAITIIIMAKSLGLRVLAEGVENEEQVSFLRAHNCEEIQGNYFSQPLSAAKFADMLRSLSHKSGAGLATSHRQAVSRDNEQG